MSKVKVLVLAADPFSAPPDGRASRLLLDEDVRQIREKVRAAEHRDALEFDVRWAVRTDDLLQALNESPPQVVHFSGHGGNKGLVLVSADGHGPHYVDAAALAQLFRAFKGDICLAVLSACFSLPQAEAIAEAVGCAIGTRGEISDRAAITFGASFYRAIAFGESVQAAFDQARAALAMEHFADWECPQLVVRPGVDPEQLVLVQPPGVEVVKRGRGRVGMAVAGLALALAGAAAFVSMNLTDRNGEPAGVPPADSALATEARRPSADTLLERDSVPPATAPGEDPVASRAGSSSSRRPVVDPQPVDQEETVETAQRTESAPTIVKLQEPDTFPVLRARAWDRTVRPMYPSSPPH